jgi:hypothetical protein
MQIQRLHVSSAMWKQGEVIWNIEKLHCIFFAYSVKIFTCNKLQPVKWMIQRFSPCSLRIPSLKEDNNLKCKYRDYTSVQRYGNKEKLFRIQRNYTFFCHDDSRSKAHA